MSRRSVVLAVIIVAVVYWSNYVKQREKSGEDVRSVGVEKMIGD